MPLREETYDLDDELERLETDDEALLQHERGVRWAAHEAADSPVGVWGADDDDGVTVTLAGLTAGEMARIEDLTAGDEDAGPSVWQLHVVAAGTAAAPYHDPSASHKQAFARVAELPRSYVQWAYAKIDALSTVGQAPGDDAAGNS